MEETKTLSSPSPSPPSPPLTLSSQLQKNKETELAKAKFEKIQQTATEARSNLRQAQEKLNKLKEQYENIKNEMIKQLLVNNELYMKTMKANNDQDHYIITNQNALIKNIAKEREDAIKQLKQLKQRK